MIVADQAARDAEANLQAAGREAERMLWENYAKQQGRAYEERIKEQIRPWQDLAQGISMGAWAKPSPALRVDSWWRSRLLLV
jgi:hypothetical protein